MASWTVVLLIASLSSINAAKILLIPGPFTSHCLEMMSVGEELLRRGHHVTLYSLLYDPKHCMSRVNVSSFKSRFKSMVPQLDPSYQKTSDDIQASSIRNIFQRRYRMNFILIPMIKNVCDAAFYDKDMLKEFQKNKYDLALVEALPFTGCLFAIPIYLGIPYAALSSFIDPQDTRMPLQTNIYPSVFTEYSNEMTFVQRLVNTMLILITPIGKYIQLPYMDLSQYSHKLAGYTSQDLVKNSVLFLENTDHIVDYPKAVFPNFVEVGGLTTSPARPLSANLKKFMDDSKQGVVLVTFGSILRGFPKILNEKLMTTFGQLKHSVLFKQDKDATYGNVKFLKWLPQNDILGHPNTKLFISHCGKNSFWEGVYHGVPIICMAIAAEAHTTKVRVTSSGIGSSINIFDDTVTDLVETINSVLTNESIYRNMNRISTLLRDRPETPRQRAASAIEHVIKYGGNHMRPPSADFSFLVYISADVWSTIFLFLAFIITFDIWIIRKCCCKKRNHVAKPKTD